MSSNNFCRPLKGKSLIDFPTSFVIIDIESTGLCPDWDSIIELAALKIVDGTVDSEFQELINPGHKISPFIEELTGITNEMLVYARTINDVLPNFIKFVGDDCIIVGHNVNFDINFIYDNRMIIEQKPISNNFVDTMRLSKRLLPQLEHHRLCDLVEYYNINIETQHRALADCYSTFEIIKELKKAAITQFSSIESFIDDFKKSHYHCKAVDLRTLSASSTDFDKSHPLFNKHCCFTGALEKYTRVEAAQIVVNSGGFCDNGVTKKTNFLVLGNNDYCSTIKDGKSSKQKKAETLMLSGCDIMILPESVFYDLIES